MNHKRNNSLNHVLVFNGSSVSKSEIVKRMYDTNSIVLVDLSTIIIAYIALAIDMNTKSLRNYVFPCTVF